MAKSKKTSDAFDMADDIRKEVAAESVADACSTSVPAIYSLAKGDNPRRAKYDKNADVIGYNLRLPANIHRLLKPHYADLIYTERKRFEYRKRAPKLADLPILLYETAPVQKVTGIIADWSILQASPEAVWTYSKTHSGLTADRFFGYYEGYDKAVAIRIYSVVPFKDSLELQTLNPELKRPPQSFCYVQSELDLPMKG